MFYILNYVHIAYPGDSWR